MVSLCVRRLRRLVMIASITAITLLLYSMWACAAMVTIDSRGLLDAESLSLVESLYEECYGEKLTIRVLPESDYNSRFELADIVFVGLLQPLSPSWSDVLVPLDPYLTMYTNEYSYGNEYRSFIEAMRQDGVAWLLPFTAIPVGILYNADMLKSAGIEPPRPDWTWDELISLAAAVTDDAAYDRKYGVLTYSQGLLFLLEAMGGSIVPQDSGDSGVRNEGFVRALHFLEDLSIEKAITIASNENLFASGRAGWVLRSVLTSWSPVSGKSSVISRTR